MQEKTLTGLVGVSKSRGKKYQPYPGASPPWNMRTPGAGGLYLWACDREVAAGMYTKLGWVVVEETVPPADHDCDLAIIMKRDL